MPSEFDEGVKETLDKKLDHNENDKNDNKMAVKSVDQDVKPVGQ